MIPHPAPRFDFTTVVSGVPRSGTSLLMQMLAAGGMDLLADSSRPPDADNPRGYFEYEPVRRLRREAACLDAAVGKAVKVIHALVTAIPTDRDVRVIMMRRDLAEVVASQQRMLARYPSSTEFMPQARLAEIFESQLRDATRWIAAQPRFSLLEVEFAVLLAEPLSAAREVASFLGGGLDCRAMAEQVDPSLYRSRLT